MILHIFAVRDVKADAFMQPFFERADGSAIRAFQAAVNDEKHAFFQSSVDYSLYSLGSFDDNSGVITPVAVPRLLVQAADLKATGV